MSYSSSDESGEELVAPYDYVSDAKEVILANDDITIENALRFNKKMQEMLFALKTKMEQMLLDCQEKYARNETLLSDVTKQSQSQRLELRYSYFYCGYPFFKNRQAFAAPPSADYMYRRKYLRELFPIDLDNRIFWTARDKLHLIQGVKKQVLNYLFVKNKDRIRKIGTSRISREQTNLLKKENDMLAKKTLKELYDLVKSSTLKIDWFTISARDLGERHSLNECMGMWNGYLMPTLNRNDWTEAEEDHLLSVVNFHSAENWMEIAAEVENRSAYQCLVHYHTVLSDKCTIKNARWTKDEDEMLVEAVEKYRIGNLIPWSKVMDKMPGRYKAQVYNRYMFTLNPDVNHLKFSVEEDCVIMAAVKEYGTNFQAFPHRLLPGRNVLQIRNRYNNVLKSVGKRRSWTADDDVRLVELVKQHGNANWSKIADELVCHNRVSCRTRYNTIQKFLQKNPDCTVEDVPRRKRDQTSKVTEDNWLETILRVKQKDALLSIKEEEEEEEEDEPPEVVAARRARDMRVMMSSPTGRRYYSYFRYSFDFQYGSSLYVTDKKSNEIQPLIARMLRSQSHLKNGESDFACLETTSAVKLERDVWNEIGQREIRFPMNLRTVLGLRGMMIMFDCKEVLEDTLPKKKKSKKRREKHPIEVVKVERPQTHPVETLQLFKQRFIALFRCAALLTRIQQPFQVDYESVSSETNEEESIIPDIIAPAVCTSQNYMITTDNGVFEIIVQPPDDTNFPAQAIPSSSTSKRKSHVNLSPQKNKKSKN